MKHSPTIALCLPLAYQDGIDQYNGIMRYITTHQANWQFVIVREYAKMPKHPFLKVNLQGIIASSVMIHGFEKDIVQSKLPFVGFDIDSSSILKARKKTVFVNIDSKAIAKTAAKYLSRDKRYASYGFVGAAEQHDWSEMREEWFRRMLTRKKMPFERFDAKEGRARTRKLLTYLAALPKPAAIFADCDRTAVAVLDACRQKGIRVPLEIAVIGVDNERITCQHSAPTLTSIQPDFEDEGYRAAAAMDALLAGQKTPRTVVCRKNHIVERRSTGEVTSATLLVKKADDLIKNEACQGLRASDVARRLGVSQRLLILRYRQIKGRSVLNTIIQTRLDAAKELLRSTKLPIREIARSTGLGNPCHAQRTFSRHFALTMREYRRSTTSVGNVADPARSTTALDHRIGLKEP